MEKVQIGRRILIEHGTTETQVQALTSSWTSAIEQQNLSDIAASRAYYWSLAPGSTDLDEIGRAIAAEDHLRESPRVIRELAAQHLADYRTLGLTEA